MRLLKQSTAFTFRIGPFLDDTDGKTAETGLTIAQGDIQISKAGGAFAQTSEASPTTTHDVDGWYQCPLTTTDTNTLGLLTVQVSMSGAIPVWEHFAVISANVYDSIIAGSDKLDVNTVELGGTAQTGHDVGSSVNTVAGRILGTLASGTHNAQSGDAYARLGAPSGASTAADIAAVKSDTAAILADTGTDGVVVASGSKTGYALTAAYDPAKTAAQASTALSSAVWTNTKAGYIDAAISSRGTGTALDAAGVRSAIGMAGANLDTQLAGVSAPSAASVADAVWDEAISGHLTAGSTGNALNAAGSAGDPWSTPLPGAYGTGTAGKIIGDNINATISSRSTITAQQVWEYANRTLSSFGALISDIWSSATRTLSAFGFNVTVGTNNDKTGYALTSAYDAAKTAAPTAATIAAAVRDVDNSSPAAGSLGEAVNNAEASGNPWESTLPGSYTAGTAGYIIGTYLDTKVSEACSSAQAGAITWKYTLTEEGSGNPIADADVWISTDSAGVNIIHSGKTDQNGEHTFYLDAGTIYVWRQKSGWNFTNPQQFTVS